MQADERETWNENLEDLSNKIYVLKTSFLNRWFQFIRYKIAYQLFRISMYLCVHPCQLLCSVIGPLSPTRWQEILQDGQTLRGLYGHLASNVIFIDMGLLEDCTLVGKPLQKHFGVLRQLALLQKYEQKGHERVQGLSVS